MRTLLLSLLLLVAGQKAFGFLPGCVAQWNAKQEGAVATAATVTKAAPGLGKRLVIDCAIGSLATGDTAQSSVISLYLKEGTTIRLPFAVSQPATDARSYGACGLNMILAANTASTLVFSSNNASNSYSTVFLSGCILNN